MKAACLIFDTNLSTFSAIFHPKKRVLSINLDLIAVGTNFGTLRLPERNKKNTPKLGSLPVRIYVPLTDQISQHCSDPCVQYFHILRAALKILVRFIGV